jgi:4-amino-4-deoxy-L-arabinose transferase-like glycosyltransferase
MATTFSNELRVRVPGDNGLARAIAFATASHGRAAATLVLVCLLAFLPGFFRLPPIDRDEARFAQATKQMVETGDYIDIRFQHEVRYKKPVGIYWAQAGVIKAAEALGVPGARTRIWLYRVPSLIGAMGAVLLTYWTALAFVSRRHAWLAAVMLATSILLGVEARLAKTDAMLLLTVVAAMGALARCYLGSAARAGAARSWIVPLIFWAALAGGVLLKGPLIVLIVGLACLALVVADRSARWLMTLRPLPGLCLFAVLVAPWFLAIVARAGDSFFVESIGRDLLGKVATGQESHGAPPGYYSVLFWLTFWPAAPLAALAAPAIWTERREAHHRFLLAWLVPSWIVFELAITKLPHYVLPLYPAVAILIARTVEHGRLSEQPWLRRATVGWAIIPMVVAVLAVGALFMLRRQFGVIAWPFAAGAIVLGFLAWQTYRLEGAERSFLRAAAASVLMAVAVYGAIMPLLRPLFPSAALARALADPGCENPAVAAAGFHEPSLVFLVGTATRLTDGSGAADFLAQGPCHFALVEARQERAFVHRAETIGLRYTAARQRVEGININGGRSLSIAIYRSGGER